MTHLEKLEAMCEKHSPAGVSRMMGVTQVTIYLWRTGKRNMGSTARIAIGLLYEKEFSQP